MLLVMVSMATISINRKPSALRPHSTMAILMLKRLFCVEWFHRSASAGRESSVSSSSSPPKFASHFRSLPMLRQSSSWCPPLYPPHGSLTQDGALPPECEVIRRGAVGGELTLTSLQLAPGPLRPPVRYHSQLMSGVRSAGDAGRRYNVHGNGIISVCCSTQVDGARNFGGSFQIMNWLAM